MSNASDNERQMAQESQQSQRRPSIVSSSRWVFAGSAVSRPIQFLNNVGLARILGPSNLGFLTLTNSAAATLGGMVGFAWGDATNKILSENY